MSIRCLNKNLPYIRILINHFGESLVMQNVEKHFPNSDPMSYQDFFDKAKDDLGVLPKRKLKEETGITITSSHISSQQLLNIGKKISELNNKLFAQAKNVKYTIVNNFRVGQSDLYSWDIRRIDRPLNFAAKKERAEARISDASQKITPITKLKEAKKKNESVNPDLFNQPPVEDLKSKVIRLAQGANEMYREYIINKPIESLRTIKDQYKEGESVRPTLVKTFGKELVDLAVNTNTELLLNAITYQFKAVQKITDNIAKLNQWYSQIKDKEQFWAKVQKDLQIPKEQIELLKQQEGSTIEDIISSFAANYSYSVEVNTAKEQQGFTNSNSQYYNQFQDNEKYWLYYIDDGGDYRKINPDGDSYIISKELYDKEFEKEYPNKPKDLFKSEENNSQVYSNLTVPGGTNYTENEISTPLITPSIKGHAEFATAQGIGWFRSDDQAENSKEKVKKVTGWEYLNTNGTIIEGEKGTPTKTRRILEVQSDLYQKSRDIKSPDEIIQELQKSGKLEIKCS